MSGEDLMHILKWVPSNNYWVDVKDLGFWRKNNNNLASTVKVNDALKILISVIPKLVY